jgi:DNA gyrase subunit A
MLISDKGTLVRTRVTEVSIQGRNTQGVRLIRLKDGEKLVGLEQVDEPDEVDTIEAEVETDIDTDTDTDTTTESPVAADSDNSESE